MNVQAVGNDLIDLVQKTQKLLMPMSPVTTAERKAGRHIERRKQRCHAMALIVVGLPGRNSRPVAPVICSLSATWELLNPCTQCRTIRARIAMACADLGRSAMVRSFSRSSLLISSGLRGRPMGIPQYAPALELIQLIYNS
jgi:hypothetical protein